jgi:hypothetical protein
MPFETLRQVHQASGKGYEQQALQNARMHAYTHAEEESTELGSTSFVPLAVCKRGTKHRCLVRVLSHFPGQVDRFCVSRAEAGLPVTGECLHSLAISLQKSHGIFYMAES